MAKIEPAVVKTLEDEIRQWEEAIKASGGEARIRLDCLDLADVRSRLPRDGNGNLDENAWKNLKEADQEALRAVLENTRDAIRVAAKADGPSDPEHLMFDEYASTGATVAWLVIVLVLTSALLALVTSFWPRATGTDYGDKIAAAAKAQDEAVDAAAAADHARAALTKGESVVAPAGAAPVPAQAMQPGSSASANADRAKEIENAAALAKTATEKRELAVRQALEVVHAIHKTGTQEQWVLLMVILLGALGGSLHFLGSLVKFVGNRQLKRSWLPYYLGMPFTGAGLAAIVYLLLRVGIVSPATGTTATASVANLNLMVIYLFAVMSGLFAKAATEKLGEVFNTLFKTSAPPSKDPAGAEAPGGGARPGGK